MPLSSETQHPLYQHNTLLHVLAWAVFNGLLSKTTRILIADKTNLTPIKTAVSLAQQLLRSSLSEQKSVKPTTASKTLARDHLILIANLEQNEEAVYNNPEVIQLSSLHKDSLNYANLGKSLLYCIDGVFHTTNGEWQPFKQKEKRDHLSFFNISVLAGKKVKQHHRYSAVALQMHMGHSLAKASKSYIQM